MGSTVNGKTLIIIDMQNDFITGSLANKDAEAIVEPICNYIKEFKGNIICTRDTHNIDYLNTPEGKKLPVEHCIKDTAGWCIDDRIQKTLREKSASGVRYLDKPTFGSLNWFGYNLEDDIYICGTCTDICVVSNALILKATHPEANIHILSNLCAGTTKENHEAALQTMRMCQCDVM